ncbi:hypothetical protein BDN70DRAFT_898808 [Pholiota conissans]|uniref:Uncharacterized protein n=1 Tax=Pholiota conissans TaxID=109636 RepID=A0A9P5YVH1_9AGAR|nr:hypothetical protein BDN70DRAFT_898808 [Pholiota conissans]
MLASIPLGLIVTLKSSSKESTPSPSFSGSLVHSEAGSTHLDLDSDASDDDQQPTQAMELTLPIAMLIAHGTTLKDAEWDALMKFVFIEAQPAFHRLSHNITHHYKQLAAAEKTRQKEEEQTRKEKKKAEEQEEKAEEKKKKIEERAKAKMVWEQKIHEAKATKAIKRAKKAAEKMAMATKKASNRINKAKKVALLNLESDLELESLTSDDETNQMTTDASQDEDSDDQITADFTTLNVGRPIVKQGVVAVPIQDTFAGVVEDEQEAAPSGTVGSGSKGPIIDKIDEEPKVASPERIEIYMQRECEHQAKIKQR